MKFYSTNHQSPTASLREAVLTGLASDGGLFMPEKIPTLPPYILKDLPELGFDQIAFHVAAALLGGDIPLTDLREIVEESLTFDAPLSRLDDSTFVLELFHGPTLAFKDFGARFMARLTGYLVRGAKRELTILVATSGDTGGAVAAGFHNTPGIKVVILYPSGKVSPIQEKQLTTFGGNVKAVEVLGTFDDCQALVKQAFSDADLRKIIFLSSANSINIARLVPQAFYYANGWARLAEQIGVVAASRSVFSVPSGNFGNLTAGLLAKRLGIPIGHFVAATNINDTIPEFLRTGTYRPRPSRQTLSNAMDVGTPSNFARANDLFKGDIEKFRQEISGYSFTDDQTIEAIKQIYKQFHYIADPHTAVGFLGQEKHRAKAGHDSSVPAVMLSTAHPAKFRETIESALGIKLTLPLELTACLEKEKESKVIANDYSLLKELLSSG